MSVSHLVAPITADMPGGKAATFEPAFEALAAEVNKLDSPSGGAVDWARVVEHSESILKSQSKDLFVGAYLAYALMMQRGLAGLCDGLWLLCELLDQYWPNLFPPVARIKARANALGWLLPRATSALARANVDAKDADVLNALVATARRLAEVSREKFADAAPAAGPLLEAIERLKIGLAPTAASLPASAPPPASSLVVPPAATFIAESSDDPATAIRRAGTLLTSAAAAIRAANPQDPTGYRLLRIGLWLHVDEAPQPGSNGRTSIAPLPANLRMQLQRMEANQKWIELLEEAESALRLHRFSLDLHGISVRALTALGASHQRSRQAIIAELASFLTRFPGLIESLAQDGSPLADDATKAWLRSEVLSSASPQIAPATAPAPDVETDVETSDAESLRWDSLFAQKPWSEALAAAESMLNQLTTAKERFRRRLELAKICTLKGHTGLARALYGTLDAESISHRLDVWDPPLAAICLEGLLKSQRALRPGAALGPEWKEHLERLAKLSPLSAFRVETGSQS